MTVHDDDILDFDFVDDETREIAPPSRSGGRPPAEGRTVAAAVAVAAHGAPNSGPPMGSRRYSASRGSSRSQSS